MIHDFTEGNITRQLFRFATPLFLSNLLQIVYNTVDMVIVGNVNGSTGLSAVAIGGDVSSFLTFVAMGFSTAGQVILSQYIGAGQRHRVGKFIGTMFSFLMLCALAFSIVCLAMRSSILRWMNTPAESWKDALDYSTVCMVGLVFVYGYNMVSAVLRGMGNSKHPFIFISIAAVLNVILDLWFVAGLRLSAFGAALATVMSEGGAVPEVRVKADGRVEASVVVDLLSRLDRVGIGRVMLLTLPPDGAL
jgi:Na+-driven multidrug efflux pump